MKGFTLIEIMIVFAIIFIIGAVTVGGCMSCTQNFIGHKEIAQNNLAKYVADLGIDAAGMTCTNKDTDGDGYVSCTVRTKAGEVLSFECPGYQGLTIIKNEGCRAPKMMIRNNAQ